LGVSTQYPSARQHQVCETKQREQLCRVLGQTFVARLAMLEQVLHHMEWMFDFGSNARLGLFNLFQQVAERCSRQLFACAGAHRYMPSDRQFQILIALFHALITLITEDIGFFTVQQGLRLDDIMHVGRNPHPSATRRAPHPAWRRW
jgi:hypothetical protein